MNIVSVRPRLDLSYDVIRTGSPQLVGVRRDLDAAVALAKWAAKRLAPCQLVVYGPDGATVVDSSVVEGEHGAPTGASSH